MYRYLLLGVLLFVGFTSLRAQQEEESLRRQLIKQTIRARTKLARDGGIWKRSNAEGQAGKSSILSTTADMDNYPISEPLFIESEIHAAFDPLDENTIVVSAIRQARMEGKIYDLSCPIYSTTDGGNTWTEAPFTTTLSDPEGILVGGGDPVFAYGTNGMVYFSWLNFFYSKNYTHLISELCWVYSTDGGYTWTTPEKHIYADADYYNPEVGASFVDKQWMAVDHSASQFRGNLYSAYVRLANDIYSMRVARKNSNADAFETVEAVVSPDSLSIVQFANIAVDPEGGVHVIFFGSADEKVFRLWHTRSTDGGVSFSPAHALTQVIFPRFSQIDFFGQIDGIPGDRKYPCPQIAADPSRPGHVYVTWTATGVSEKSVSGADIYFSRSSDYGATWSSPFLVNDDDPATGRDQYYSSIAVNGNGELVITWYDMREDVEGNLARYYYAISRDGGEHFSRNAPVATVPMNMWMSQDKNDGFGIGEYTQVLLTNDYIFPFWCDGRKNNGYLQVYGARIDLATLSVQQHTPIDGGFRILDVYPQPFTDTGMLRFEVDQAMSVRFVLSDLLGRTAKTSGEFQYDVGVHEYSLDIQGLPAGGYYLQLLTSEGSTGLSIRIVE